MENWQQDLIKILESAKNDFDKLFISVTVTVENATEDLTKEFETFTIELENNLNKEVDNFLQEFDEFIEELLQPLLEQLLEDDDDESSFFEEDINPFSVDFDAETEFYNPKIKPNAENHSACVGCSNYHGRIYNNNLLVCAIHPYGWEGENCPDWEE